MISEKMKTPWYVYDTAGAGIGMLLAVWMKMNGISPNKFEEAAEAVAVRDR